MFCPHCGAQVVAGSAFCTRCRKRVGPPPSWSSGAPGAPAPPPERPGLSPQPSYANYPPPPLERRRPSATTAIAVYDMLIGVVGLGLSLIALVVAFQGKSEEGIPIGIFAIVYGGVSLVHLAAGYGLWGLHSWGRTLQLVLSFLGLLGIPCGTLISILVLVHLFNPGVKLLFSGAPVETMTPAEQGQVGEALRSKAMLIALVVLIVAVPILAAVVGIIAAIAIPSLLRARVSANEAASIGDMRSMISAQAAYASANGGFYDTPECLATPSRCIPRYSESAPFFLEGRFATETTRHGYSFTFSAGAPAPAELLASGQVSPSSLTEFAYVAVPVTLNRTGTRAFCGDASGMVCAAQGLMAPAEGGRCPSDCQPLN